MPDRIRSLTILNTQSVVPSVVTHPEGVSRDRRLHANFDLVDDGENRSEDERDRHHRRLVAALLHRFADAGEIGVASRSIEQREAVEQQRGGECAEQEVFERALGR